jgi:hypothetical protein
MHPNAEFLITHLSAERETVQDCWRRMGIQRSVLQRMINANYDELVSRGMRLHTATTSQAAARSRYIEVDGRRYSHISRYQLQPPATIERSDPRVDEFLRECGL